MGMFADLNWYEWMLLLAPVAYGLWVVERNLLGQISKLEKRIDRLSAHIYEGHPDLNGSSVIGSLRWQEQRMTAAESRLSSLPSRPPSWPEEPKQGPA